MKVDKVWIVDITNEFLFSLPEDKIMPLGQLTSVSYKIFTNFWEAWGYLQRVKQGLSNENRRYVDS